MFLNHGLNKSKKKVETSKDIDDDDDPDDWQLKSERKKNKKDDKSLKAKAYENELNFLEKLRESI